ncbi:MFS transporter [Desulforhabdus amnigena]|uniref:MFS transporter n=1 Tax=Desulforhabdus amnigena TaxID=40218 RepID=A0A9W6FW70_9BACT|nr:MFS transporter [Desulforhabdus amnigena]NLJ26763.1 MFS transporter [Deltaproteobacteria bacterium]GLI35979.1 MFS transporter [Desulforhabdus amnigena]
MPASSEQKKIISWALYDWANSAFATTVMAGFFPIFFKQYWSVGTSASVSTFQLGAGNSLASIVVAAMAPILGAIADRGSTRKKFLFYFAMMGIVMTGSLYFVARGNWQVALALYILATIGFSGGNIFYDSLLVNVAGKEKMDSVSALGFALGYLGGGLLFALNVLMTLTPQTFGLVDAGEAVRISFVCVAVWWGVFSIPVFFFVDEPKTDAATTQKNAVIAGFQQLASTFRKIRNLRVVFLFLLGYWLYIDGVDTIVRMAVDYGMSLGFAPKSLITALLLTQFVGFPASIAFGRIGQRLGAKKGIYIGVSVYLGVTVWGFFMRRELEFYLLAIVIGLVQGGVQSLSRSFYTRIIPKNQAAEFFGFYNLLGKFAAVIGPFLMGWVGIIMGNTRYSILSISLLFLCGGALLYFVNEEEGQRLAQQMEKM